MIIAGSYNLMSKYPFQEARVSCAQLVVLLRGDWFRRALTSLMGYLITGFVDELPGRGGVWRKSQSLRQALWLVPPPFPSILLPDVYPTPCSHLYDILSHLRPSPWTEASETEWVKLILLFYLIFFTLHTNHSSPSSPFLVLPHPTFSPLR